MLPTLYARRLLSRQYPLPANLNLLVLAMPRKRSARALATAAPVDESSGDMLSTAMNEAAESVEVLSRRVSSRIRAKKVEVDAAKVAEIQTDAAGPVATGEDADSPLGAPDEQEEPPKKKRRRTKKNAEPEVYEIEPVETKTTTWRGKRI